MARPVEAEVLARMGGLLAHRGPDGEGIWRGAGVGLVHRRLSIIDLEGGRQPMTNEDGSIWVVFNGEIYNFQGLREELERKGHRFQTQSDTEVIVHLYEEEGERLVSRLRGMFAFALWDEKRRRLVLARDRVGIKPIYYYRDAKRLVFGSELKAVLACPGVPRDIDPLALEDYLAFGVVPGERSIFAGIKKLPPAHTLVVGADTFDAEPVRYWRLELRPNETLSVDDWQEAIREKLTETVRLHMIADVPVGAFLSGGIDSSIVVGLASEVSSAPIRTFSMGFRESRFNELPFARQVAEHFGTRHTEEIVTADAVSLLDELTYFYDEPFADSSAVPTYLMSQVTARSVKVVLSGDGGDEAFGGYSRYAHDLREAAVRRRLPGWFRLALGPFADAWPKADWLPKPLRLKTALQNLSLDAGPAYANTLTLCRQPLRRQLLAPDVRQHLNGHRPEDAVLGAHRTAPASDPLAGMIAADVAMLLPDDFLVKVDRASMACGLEVRPPLLDHELLELAATIPSHYKVHNGSTKWILKETFRERLPSGILDRPKQGFEIPIDEWLRGPLRGVLNENVESASGKLSGLVDRAAVHELVNRHATGVANVGHVLWSLLVLARWAAKHA